MTPCQKHTGKDTLLLANREKIYKQARLQNPSRWSGDIRQWTPITLVCLNPNSKIKELINKIDSTNFEAIMRQIA